MTVLLDNTCQSHTLTLEGQTWDNIQFQKHLETGSDAKCQNVFQRNGKAYMVSQLKFRLSQLLECASVG